MEAGTARRIYVGAAVESEEPEVTVAAAAYLPDTDTYTHERSLPADPQIFLEYLDRIRMDLGEHANIEVGYVPADLGLELYRKLVARSYRVRVLDYLPPEIPRARQAHYIANALATERSLPEYTKRAAERTLARYEQMRDEQLQILRQVENFVLEACAAAGAAYPGPPEELWTDKHLAWLDSLGLDGPDRYRMETYGHDIATLRNRIDRYDVRMAFLRKRIEEEEAREKTPQHTPGPASETIP